MRHKFGIIMILLSVILVLSCTNKTKSDNTTNTEDIPCGITEEYADSLENDTIIKVDIDGNVYKEY